jgi:hypothetical protein
VIPFQFHKLVEGFAYNTKGRGPMVVPSTEIGAQWPESGGEGIDPVAACQLWNYSIILEEEVEGNLFDWFDHAQP